MSDKQYTPTPADEALYLAMRAQEMVGRIQQEYTAGNIVDLPTYNRLYELATRTARLAKNLCTRLEGETSI